MRREHTATDVNFSLYTWVWSQEINLWEIGLHLTFKANWNTLNGTKFERKRIHFIETFLLPSPSLLLQHLSFEGPCSVLYRESEIVADANPRWDIWFYCQLLWPKHTEIKRMKMILLRLR